MIDMSSSSKGTSSCGSSTFSFSFCCGSCCDSKSVSVAESVYDSYMKSPIVHPPPPSREMSNEKPAPVLIGEDPEGTPSFSGLLRQLDDLEETVLSLTPPIKQAIAHDQEQVQEYRERRGRSNSHGRTRSEGLDKVLEESVVVVVESEDPLSDFRRSMLQMIVEEGIVGQEDLSQLLKRFLTLNSPRHHDVILQAFANIWNEVSAGHD